jgi:LysM repeat protein
VERSRVARWAAPVAFLVAVTILALVLRAGFEHGKQHATRPTTSVISKHKKKKTHSHAHPKQHVQTYTVESGDTFESIATKTGTTVARLKQLNPSVDPNALQVGETIKVQ